MRSMLLFTLALLAGTTGPAGTAWAQNRPQAPKIDPDKFYQQVFSRVVERHIRLFDKKARDAFITRFNPQHVGPLGRMSKAYDKAQEMLDSLGCGDRVLDPAAALTTVWQRDSHDRGSHGLKVTLQHESALSQKLPTNGNPIIRNQALTIADGREDLEVDQADSDIAPAVKYKDAIISIDGELTDGMSADEARSKMCGSRGSDLSLWVRRNVSNVPRINSDDHDPAAQFIPVTITRAWLVKDCVTGHARYDKPNELYELKIGMCDPAAVPQMEKQLSEVAAKGFKGVLLDLRFGNKEETARINNALMIAQYFIDTGLLAEGQMRVGDKLSRVSWTLDKEFVTFDSGGKIEKRPRLKRLFTGSVVVLIDNDSCLCNQMLAAILQANGIGVFGPQPDLAPTRGELIDLDLEGWMLDLAIGHVVPAGHVEPGKVVLRSHTVTPTLDTTGKAPAEAINAAVEALKKLCGLAVEPEQNDSDID